MTLQFQVENITNDQGATAEIATVTFQGHPHTAMGSIVDHSGGYVGAYVREVTPLPAGSPASGARSRAGCTTVARGSTPARS